MPIVRYDGLMPAMLVITTEEGVVIQLALGSLPLTLGRAEGNIVRGVDRRVSRHHALVRRLRSGQYEVEDLGSTNGTTLNGQPLSARQAAILNAGDRLAFAGMTAEFKAEELEERSANDLIDELRGDAARLIEEAKDLRQAVQDARDAQGKAERTRDEEHDEATRLRELQATTKQQVAALEARIDALGVELRNERAARATATPSAPAAGGDLQAELQREKKRLREVEEREGQLALREVDLKKEIERLQERCRKHEARENDLTNAVKPALLRVATLTREVETLRIELAKKGQAPG